MNDRRDLRVMREADEDSPYLRRAEFYDWRSREFDDLKMWVRSIDKKIWGLLVVGGGILLTEILRLLPSVPGHGG